MTSTKAYFREAKETNNWLVGYDVADNEFKPLPENADKYVEILNFKFKINLIINGTLTDPRNKI